MEVFLLRPILLLATVFMERFNPDVTKGERFAYLVSPFQTSLLSDEP